MRVPSWRASAVATRLASARRPSLEKVVDEKNIPADIKAYPDAGHSFANKLPAQPLIRITGFGYNEAAEADAWSRVFAFFGEHLRAPTG